jgi:UTP--glucose-1-phosphate uridylyltransferase
VTEKDTNFGSYLRLAREALGLRRESLAQKVNLHPSYIYRLEVGNRRPSREVLLSLAEALEITSGQLNKWLQVAGFASLPVLAMMQGAVRARGGQHRHQAKIEPSAGTTARWATWLEAIGLQDSTVARLMRAMDIADPAERREASKIVSRTFISVTDRLESLVRTAIIPAAKENHLIAPHVMQRMLLRSVSEAASAGISNVVLVLAQGMVEPIFTPIKEAFQMAIAPNLNLQYCLQSSPEGLGDAVLRAEEFVGNEPFAVLLPDDVVQRRTSHAPYVSELHDMVQALEELDGANLVAVTAVPRSKMPQYGVAVVSKQGETRRRWLPVAQLIEKPDSAQTIPLSVTAFGIVGRYLLQPAIFDKLRELKKKEARPLHLTVALEHLRQGGHQVYSFELKGIRQDIGEVLGQATDLIYTATDRKSSEYKM